MQVVVRVDANSEIGAGHLFRCITLVDKLVDKAYCNPADVLFLTHQLTNTFHAQLIGRGYQLKEINVQDWNEATDCDFCTNALKEIDFVDLLIVDHYQLSSTWEKPIARFCHTLIVIDDLANRSHYCDILLDQTMERTPAAYNTLTPRHTSLLLGTDYILLRDEFSELHNAAKQKRRNTKTIQQLLVSLGATDHLGLSSKIVVWLSNYFKCNKIDPIETTVVVSSAAKHIRQLEVLSTQYQWLNLVVDAQNMAELILIADIAIGACGTSSWERASLGLPTLSVITASNQSLVNRALDKFGAIIDLGHAEKLTESIFVNQLNRLKNNPTLYQATTDKCFSVCSANGAHNVAMKINQHALQVRKAQQEDCMQLFSWQSNPEIRKFARNNKPVELEEHVNWFKNTLNNTSKHLYLLEQGGCAVGMIRLDSISGNQYEISILIAPESQGQRLALRALKSIPNEFAGSDILATVLPDNIVSHKLFQQAGYIKLNDTTYRITLKGEKKHVK